MKRLLSLFILSFVLCAGASAAGPQWRDYTSLKYVKTVYEHNGTLWIATHGGLIAYNETTKTQTLYTAANSGLPSNTVETVGSDKENNIWIGTYDAGIAMFDGSKWTKYNTGNSKLPSNAVQAIYIDAADNKWIGTGEGLVKINKDGWQVFNGQNSGITESNIWCLDMDMQGNLWIGGSNNLCMFDGKSTFTTFPSEVPVYGVNTMFCDSRTNSVFTGGFGGAFVFKDNKWSKIDSVNMPMSIMNAQAIRTDNKGNVWLSTAGGDGIYKFDGKTWTQQMIGGSENAYLNYINGLTFTNDGKLIAATRDGITSFDGNGWNAPFIMQGSLNLNTVNTICSDKMGSMWVTNELGIAKVDGQNTTQYTYKDLPILAGTVNSVKCQKAGVIWVCAYGVAREENGNWITYNTTNSNITDIRIDDITFDSKSDTAWLVSDQSLISFDGKDFHNLGTIGTQQDYLTRVTSNAEGVWVGTAQGNIYQYRNGKFTFYPSYQGGYVYLRGYVNDMKTDALGNLWVSSWGGGINKFDGKNWTVDTANNAIVVNNLCPDSKGGVWFTTEYPTRLMNSRTHEEYSFYNSPMPADNIKSMTLDENGNLWMSGGMELLEFTAAVETSIDNTNTIQNGVALYPNPASTKLHLNYSLFAKGHINVILTNALGQQVYRMATEQPEGRQDMDVDVSSLSRGVYTCTLQTDNGQVFTNKFILQ
jgi:ligand-binding sensor domain-containing protein